MTTHKDIVGRAGGVLGAAALCDCSEHAVRKWAIRGVPQRHWYRLIDAGFATRAELERISNQIEERVA